MRRYCPKCRRAAEWSKEEDPKKTGLVCSRCGHVVTPEKLEELIPVTPLLTDEQRQCNHNFEDVTEQRRGLVEKQELPGWAQALKEKGDRRWANRPEKWRTLTYKKCGKCGLLRISNQP